MTIALTTYRFRLKPTKAQHVRLAEALEHSRCLYNAALAERICGERAPRKAVLPCGIRDGTTTPEQLRNLKHTGEQ